MANALFAQSYKDHEIISFLESFIHTTLHDKRKCGYIQKEEITMKAAITYDNGSVFQHFGRTEEFMIYTIEDGKVTDKEKVDASSTGGHGALAPFLCDHGVEALICGGIGGGARAALGACGIKIYPGVSGSADDAATAFAEGRLEFDENAECHHHDHEHEGGCHHDSDGAHHCCH